MENEFLSGQHISVCRHAIQKSHSLRQKMFKYRHYSSPYFSIVDLNTEIYFSNLHIQSQDGKTRTRENFAFRHFSRSFYHDVRPESARVNTQPAITCSK